MKFNCIIAGCQASITVDGTLRQQGEALRNHRWCQITYGSLVAHTPEEAGLGFGFDFNVMGSHMFVETRYISIGTNNGRTHYLPSIVGFKFY